MSTKFIINVSDSFVHPCKKMNKENGEIGHGERRLYVGNDEYVSKFLTTKPWTFDFSKFCEPRDNIINIQLVQQDGKQDTRRFYLGVKNTSKDNIQKFDELRKSLIPQKTCFIIEEKDEYFNVDVLESQYAEKTSNKTKGYSKIAIRWLEYESRKNNIQIDHAENVGEFSIRTMKGYKWPVDGFCKDTKTVYEFYGDYYHGNPKKFCQTDLYHGVPYLKKWEKDELKRKTLEDLGYKVVIMWESDWIEHEKLLKMSNMIEDM